MADESTPNTTTNEPAPQTAPAAQPTTITPDIQALIDAARREGHDAGAAATRRSLEGKQKQPEPAKPPPPTEQQPKPQSVSGMSADEVRAMLSLNREIGKAGLAADAEQVIEQLYQVERPSTADIPAWTQAKAKLFAKQVTAPQAQNPNPNNHAATPTPTAPLSTPQVPAPLSTVPTDTPENPLTWDQSQLDAYIAKHYPNPHMPWHHSNAKARRELAQKVHAQVARLTIDTTYRPR